MKYENGKEARCGDVVEYENMLCKVVVNIDTLEYAKGFEEQLRQFLRIQDSGLIVETEKGGLLAIFYPDKTLKLLKSAP